MKKIIDIIYLLLVMTIFGCTDNEVIERYNEIRITANLSQNSRTSYSSEDGITKVSWVEGDEIGLFSKNFINSKYIALNSAEESIFVSSESKIQVAEGDSVFALYPYNLYLREDNPYYKDIVEGRIPLNGTFWQYYEKGLSPNDYMVSWGVVKNNELSFQFEHLFAILRITFPKEAIKGNTTIKVSSSENISIEGIAMFDTRTKTFISGEYGKLMQCVLEKDSIDSDEVTIDIAILPQSENAMIDIQSYYLNTFNLNTLYVGKAPKGGMKAGNVYKINLNEERFENRREEDLKALKAFYKATNGDNWKNNTNWFSSEPLYNWYGLDNSEDMGLGEIKKFDYVNSIRLGSNGLHGTLPKEFVYFLDNVKEIDLSSNGLVGKIPEEVLKHFRWNEVGWNIIKQNRWIGGGFDLSEGSNLYTEDFEAEYLTGEKISFLNLLKRNKISLLMIDTPEDVYANMLLSYRNKGFGIIVRHSGGLGESKENTIVKTDKYPIKDGIIRLWENDGFRTSPLGEGLAILGSTYLLDENGCVIDYYMRDWGLPESFYSDKIDSVLYARLGEPEDHPPFVTEYYTSTDYSRDGEVVTLQKATEGKGIDLVFMGDSYVDKAMNEGGKYEKDMRASMEYFFEIEPYKSFRNRFNVYTVKVISPNEEVEEGCKQRINYSDEVCFEYAGKIQGVDLNQVTIVNVTNHPNNFFVSGFTTMYETGASVAHIELGGPSDIIVHEAGGHGFAKLLDEYIYDGYESNWLPDNEIESFNNWIKTEYHNRGWGANVDVTSDPSKVIWSHFLEDERYKKEVGVYQGAWLYPFDLWRPSENSVMNNDYSRFNAPSREAIYKRIMELSEGENWTYNYEDFVKYDAVNRNTESRSVSTSSQSRQKVHKDHRPPTFIKGSWRDAAKGKSKIVVPFR